MYVTIGQSSEEAPEPKKSRRTPLTEYQRSELMKRYERDPFIRGKERELLSRNLGLSERRVMGWFIGRRRLDRKMHGRRILEEKRQEIRDL